MAILEQTCLLNIFRTNVFIIPDYQRGYAWEKRQVDDFIEDLNLLNPQRTHFFGTLVIRATGERLKDENEDPYTVYEIIDGQQRLTTCVILLSVIYEEMKARKDYFKKQPEGLWRNFIGYLDENQNQQPKLILNQDCREYFETNILKFDSHSLPGDRKVRSHRLISQARDRFQNYLKDLQQDGEEKYLERLDQLYDKVKEGLQVIVYPVDAELDAAGLIFERMNDRGKPLTELELVKNYIMYLASKLVLKSDNDLRDHINKTWSNVFHYLMQIPDANENDEDGLLRYHWIMTKTGNNRPVTSRNLKEEFNLKKYSEERHAELYHDLQTYLNTLGKAASAYRDIRNPEHSNAFGFANQQWREKIRELSQKLRRLDALASFMPLLMAVRLKLDRDDSGETYYRVLEICEKFAFRVYAWNGSRTRTGQSSLYRLASQYYRGGFMANSLICQIADLIFYYCPDKRFENDFEKEPYSWYNWVGIKYFLYEYEQHRVEARGLSLRYHWEDLQKARKDDTIEHILPQNPRPAYWKEKFTDEERERWKNDIGNLTLTYYNGELSDRAFPEKVDGKPGQPDPHCYRRSLIVIEQEVIDYAEGGDWTAASIQKRRENIKQWALKRWQVNRPAPDPTPQPKPATAKPLDQPVSIPNWKAAQVSRYQRDPETWLISIAEKNGLKDAFCELVNAARESGLYVRFQNNWWVFSITPPWNKSKAIFWVGADLYFNYDPASIERLYKIPTGVTLETLGVPPKRPITMKEALTMAAAIRQLFTKN